MNLSNLTPHLKHLYSYKGILASQAYSGNVNVPLIGICACLRASESNDNLFEGVLGPPKIDRALEANLRG